MIRYLSAAWLARLPAADVAAGPTGSPSDGVTIRHVVRGAPDGEAVYDVRVVGGTARVQRAGTQRAELTVFSDYGTAAAIASGRLSPQEALAAGAVKLRGELAGAGAAVAGTAWTDPLPAALRSVTEVPR